MSPYHVFTGIVRNVERRLMGEARRILRESMTPAEAAGLENESVIVRLTLRYALASGFGVPIRDAALAAVFARDERGEPHPPRSDLDFQRVENEIVGRFAHAADRMAEYATPHVLRAVEARRKGA